MLFSTKPTRYLSMIEMRADRSGAPAFVEALRGARDRVVEQRLAEHPEESRFPDDVKRIGEYPLARILDPWSHLRLRPVNQQAAAKKRSLVE